MSIAEQLVEMGFEKNQIDSAINAGKAANMEQAIDWITTHDNEIASGTAVSSEPTLNLSSSGTAATTTEAQGEVNSLKCDECGKLLKDADAATTHAIKSNHSSFSECTDVIKPPTAEEKEEMKRKIQERIVARRKEQQIADQQKEIEMEKKRIVDGKALAELKQKRDEDEMKKLADANRREKMETQLAKQRAIDQIEADKRARRERAAAEKSGVAVEVPAEKPQHIAAPQPTRQYDECNLQVRLPDGSTVRQIFKAADQFEKVVEWVRGTQQSRPFILIQNYPKKEFNESDNYKSLTDLGLVPSGSLIVKALAHFQT